VTFYVESIPNRNSPPAVLLRQAWREGKRIRRKTIANLSKLPPHSIHAIRTVLKGGVAFPSLDQAVTIRRSLPHGHVAALLGLARHLGFPRLLHRNPSRNRSLALAAICARLLHPASKLATARGLSPHSAACSLGRLLELGPVSGNELLAMLDWLRQRQNWIQRSLARRHLGEGTLILYDVTSTYLEGQCCPLAAFGYNRDRKRGKRQIVCGLLCAADGCPVAVEVFAGNTADPTTVSAQISALRERFGIRELALVGDRGMLTTARIREDLSPAKLDWISALKTRDIRRLLQVPAADAGLAGDELAKAPLQPDALVPDQVAEIRSPEFPDERLLVCLNPRLQQERARKREDLLQATERILEQVAGKVRRGREPWRGQAAINRRLGREINRYQMEKHFQIEVHGRELSWSRKSEQIAAEARLDGVYVVRTSLSEQALGADAAVAAYKALARVERAFRSLKTTQLELRPLYVYSAEHVRGHVFLCMLAYYLEWHLRRRLAPLLFEDSERAAAQAQRGSPVEPAQVSPAAQAKAASKRTAAGLPAQSLRSLLRHLGTLTLNDVTLAQDEQHEFPLVARPTALQAEAFALLDVDPEKIVSSKLAS
jgi:transposase